MTSSYQFRCRSKTEPDLLHTITIQAKSASCSCDGFDGIICSHIDATLIAGERAMVPQEDWAVADQAMSAVAGRIVIPPAWKASWRKLLWWRGLSPSRIITIRTGLTGNPIVCFTGKIPKPRSEIFEDAVARGWEPVDRPHSQTCVLVAADVEGNSIKLQSAREHGIPILSYEEWQTLTTDGELNTRQLEQ